MSHKLIAIQGLSKKNKIKVMFDFSIKLSIDFNRKLRVLQIYK